MTAIAERFTGPLATPKRVGVAGVFLGIAAFWIALPPIHDRSLLVPALLAAAGVAAGIYAAAKGSVRPGWGAIVIGALGVAGAYLATRSSVDNLQIVFTWSSLIAAMFVFATPLVYGSLGGIFSERSGVVNIGIEGMMLMGAFWGIWGADVTGSWITGVLIGMAAGGAFLSVGVISSFNENMTGGRGFIALAAVIFGNWRPFGAFAAACLFGFSTALAFRLGDAYSGSVAGLDVVAQMLPYVLTLIVVAGVIGKSIPPAAVGRPYTKQ